MADYFTEFSFVIPVTPAQGNWFTQVHELAAALIGYAEDGAARETIEGPQDVMSAALELAEKRDGDPWIEVTHDETAGTIWVCSEDSGDLEYTADLAQAFLKRFDLDLVVAFQWANTCSKPLLDAFAGGAVVISRRTVAWFDTGSLLEKALATETARLRLRPDEALADADLDEAAHDIASSLAADANNGGIGSQLDFLCAHGWTPPAQLLREVWT
jgi:hypothetical protein